MTADIAWDKFIKNNNLTPDEENKFAEWILENTTFETVARMTYYSIVKLYNEWIKYG